ncbi:MAG: SIMPL domain-containing protein [Bacteroidaceae bacterium]|nr:SIMPL domain-containing protein [Bacteroidaceae bacterium]
MKVNRYISLLAAMVISFAAMAQSITFDTEEAEYQAIGVYDTWEKSPFRTGELEGNVAVVTNHLNYVDDLLGEAPNATSKMLAVQRSRFGSNTFGVRVDLKEPIDLTPTAKYVHALIYKPVAGRVMLVGLGKRNDRDSQPKDVEQFWELASVDFVADKWQDAVFTIKGAGNISIYSLVFVVDCESPHNLTEDFVAYVDEIEIDNSPTQRIVYTDYALNFDKTANSTHGSRWIRSIAFNGSADGNKSITLNTASNKQMYYDMTEGTMFSAKAGETITPTFTMNGNWMHGYVYLDRGNDGRFHAKLNDDLTIADGSDVMTYSFYSGSTDGSSGVNSNGTSLTGNARNVLNPPTFTIPTDLANGIYRMRYKIDWNSIDPGGNTDANNLIAANGGAIVDVLLNVHGATTTISAHQRNCELISAETGLGLGGTEVPYGQGYKIKVVPSGGFAYRGVTVVHGYNIVIDANQDYAITSEQYVHGNKQYSIDYIPAEMFDENNEYTIPAEYIDGEVHVIADVISGYSVRYNHMLNGEVVNTEVLITTDGTYPAPTQPWGVTLSGLPTGTVTENCVKEITATFNASALPFTAAASYEEIDSWYYMTLNNKYLFYEQGATSIPLNKAAVDTSNKDAYTFAFVGDPYTGYQIVNRAAGENYILSSSTTMLGETGANTHPVMTATPVPEGNNTHWVPTSSTHATGGFYLEQKGYSNNRLNNRSNTMAYWTAGYGAGSTLTVTFRDTGKLGELTDLIDEIGTNGVQPGTDPGYYTEATYATLAQAIENAKGLTAESDKEVLEQAKTAINNAFDALETAGPVKGNYYVIKSAYPNWSTGDKAIYSDGTKTKWKDIDYTDKSFFWLLEDIVDGKYIFKNANDSKYMNGQSMSETKPTGATLTWLNAAGQYNIISNGVTMHTEGHTSGAGESGNIVSWNSGANDCSAWYLLTADAPTATGTVDVRYTYKNNGNTWSSEQKTLNVNTPYTAATAAYGTDVSSTAGYGLVRSSQNAINIICTLNGEQPFEFEQKWNNEGKWYYLALYSKYLFYEQGATSIPLNKTSVDTSNEDAYSFAFIGNPYTGYRIVNRAAGEDYILSSSTTMSGTTGGGTFPVMTATPVPEGNNTYWIPTSSTHATGGFYLEQKGYSSNKMNLRDGKLAYWSTGKDQGSTFTATKRILPPQNGKFYTISNNGNYIQGATSDGKIAMSTANGATAIFYLDGNHLLSYSNGQYIGLNASDWAFEAVGSNDISEITFAASANAGVYNIKSADRWLHSSDTYVNRCSNNTCGAAHNWVVTEVTALPVTIGDAGYSTLFAPVALEIPDGITAYYAVVNGEYIDLYEFEGTIPANQAAILKGARGTYNFAITDDVEFAGENHLLGTTKKIATSDVTNPYTLQTDAIAATGVVMRRYTGENINGFKMYMEISDADAAAFSFRFPGTTAVENVEAEGAGNGRVYDLFGRPVQNPTKGIYVIDGNKVIY